jgi:heterodisulfide reductase subunit C
MTAGPTKKSIRWRRGRQVVLQKEVLGPVGRRSLHAGWSTSALSFGIETADHFLKGLGAPFLARSGPLALFQGFISVVAVAVLVGSSDWPSPFREEDLARSELSTSLWWRPDRAADGDLLGLRHRRYCQATGSCTIILAFRILRSKHHPGAGAVDIFFKTERWAKSCPGPLGARRRGATLSSDDPTAWKMRLDFLTCVECKRCTEQCPANGAGQELDPRGFILAGRRTLLQLTEDVAVLGNVISERALGQCTSCGACEAICPVGIEHLQILTGAKRAQALASGQGMVAGKFLQGMERYGNPFAASSSTRERLVSELEIPRFEPGKTEWLL